MALQQRRRMVVTLAGAIALPGALAAAPRTYALVSLVVDGLRVVGQEPRTGVKLDRNEVEIVPLPSDVIDRRVLALLSDAVARADPTAKRTAMRLNDPRHYSQSIAWVDGPVATVPDEIVQVLRGTGVTHLLMVTRHRDDARLQAANDLLGSGKLEGLGLYVDRHLRMQCDQTAEVSLGYLAPYVYVRASLVDLASLKVEGTRAITRGKVLGAGPKQSGGDAWNILTDAQKVQTLVDMLESELGKILPELLKA